MLYIAELINFIKIIRYLYLFIFEEDEFLGVLELKYGR
jgi:hypothetical protein